MAAVPALPDEANVIAHDVAATLRLRRRLTRHLAGRRRALNRKGRLGVRGSTWLGGFRARRGRHVARTSNRRRRE